MRLADFAGTAARFTHGEVRRILDIGCGDGVLLSELAALFPRAHLVGVDLSRPNILLARQSCDVPNVSFVEADYMGFDNRPFDMIVSYSTINLLPIGEGVLLGKVAGDMARGEVFIVSMPDDYLYNRAVSLVRQTLRLIRSDFLDALIFRVGRLLTPRDVSDEQILQNVGYMYIVPLHVYRSSFRNAACNAGLELVHAEREPSPSVSKLRHVTIVFRKM